MYKLSKDVIYLSEKINHEKILIAFALCLCAGIICYNYFFIPTALPSTVIYADKEQDTENAKDYQEKELKQNNTQNLLNINTATAEELADTLPRVGKSTAALIVSYREKNGPFKNIEDIKNVKGIGDKTFEKMKDLICV